MKIGILGLGSMANTMAKTLVQMDDVECLAAASRDEARARTFAQKYGFQRAYGSYRALAEDPDVELIYIASPHSHHYEHAKLCLECGKPVLVEKAFTVNARQAEELIALARQKNLLLAEAIWTRYAPIRSDLERLVRESPVGKITALSANLGYPVMHNDRLNRPELAGGALLDVGVYPLNFALMAFGTDIASVSAVCVPLPSGPDMQNTVTLTYRDGRIATLMSSISAFTDRHGVIMGNEGYFVCDNINNISEIRVYHIDPNGSFGNRPEVAVVHAPTRISGYEYEIRSAMRAIQEGRVECDEMPHAETLRVMRILDEIRSQMGVKYPCE